jgi:hypothetical protein
MQLKRFHVTLWPPAGLLDEADLIETLSALGPVWDEL